MIADKLNYYELSMAVVFFSATFIGLVLAKAFVLGQLRRLSERGHLGFLSYLERVIDATRLPFMLLVSVLAGVSQLQLDPRYHKWINYAWIIVLIGQVALWANRIILIAIERTIDRNRQKNPSCATHLMVVSLVGRIALWSIAALVALDNLGFNITTLMASLGIGGIAVSLALQNILGDIFSSISIALDKPFSIGDFIIVDDYMGTVEYVGLKTTRIRSLGGEQIIFSNTELLKQRIRNYQVMRERRIQFNFGLSYETSLENVKRIPGIVREIILNHEQAIRLDRVHFKSYGENALEFEVVYFMLSPDFNKYMDLQQDINLSMLQRFQEIGVRFAHPVRHLYLPNMEKHENVAVFEQRRAANQPAHH